MYAPHVQSTRSGDLENEARGASVVPDAHNPSEIEDDINRSPDVVVLLDATMASVEK